MSLSTYRAKRHFNRTPEPRGHVAAGTGGGRFVVQRHAARTLHFDLRLEMDGVFKSWAVTRVPSADPKVRRLAVQVEDHPLDYGSFEGTIPKGEYGGGTVQVWDRGHWQSQTASEPSSDLKRGRLSFTLGGRVMKGGWALIRLKGRGSRPGHPSWLLVKERDAAARPGNPDALARNVRSVKSGRTLKEIAAHKRRSRVRNDPGRKRR